MKTIALEELGIKERHHLMTSSVWPRPIAWVSTINNAGIPNLSPYSFFNCFSTNPPILVFSPSLRGADGTSKDTLNNLYEVPEVCINVVPRSMVEKMNETSAFYPPEVSEFEQCNLDKIASEKIKPFRVAASPIQMECVVNQIVPMGTKGASGNLVIAQVILMHVAEKVLTEHGAIAPELLNLVARGGKDLYYEGSINNSFSLKKLF